MRILVNCLGFQIGNKNIEIFHKKDQFWVNNDLINRDTEKIDKQSVVVIIKKLLVNFVLNGGDKTAEKNVYLLIWKGSHIIKNG